MDTGKMFWERGPWHICHILSIALAMKKKTAQCFGLHVILTAWPLKMRPIGCPETSVNNHQSTLRNIPEERRPNLHRDGSLKSRIYLFSSQGAQHGRTITTGCGNVFDAVNVKQWPRGFPSCEALYVQHNAVSSLLIFLVCAACPTYRSYTGWDQHKGRGNGRAYGLRSTDV
jgi:hypothetical protein